MRCGKFFILSVLFMALILSGCGAPGRGAADGKGDPSEPVLAAADPDADIGDGWKRDGFVCQAARDVRFSSGTFREIRYIELAETAPEFAFSSRESQVAFLRDIRCELITYTTPDDARGKRYFLETRSLDEETPRRVELFTDGELPSGGRVINMDVVTGTDIALLFRTEKNEYRVLHLDGDGHLFSDVDLASCYREQKIEERELGYYWWCDEEGNSYAISINHLLLYIYDDAGELLMTHRLSGNRGETRPCVCHAPDGSLIFGFNSGQESSIIRFDLEAKAPQTLATLPIERLWKCTMEKDGRFLLVDEVKVWLWDTVSGEITCLFNFYGSDIKGYGSILHAGAASDGRLLLYVWGGSDGKKEKENLYVFSDQVEEAGGITLVNFTTDSYVQQSAALFNRGQEEKEKILYNAVEVYGQERDDYWTRLMASFVAGKGPDILCLYADDEHLDTLWEKGILADLDGWIPQETLDQIYPGLLACGIIDGKLAGVSESNFDPVMVLTTDDFCPSGHWSQQEALAKIRENPDMESFFFGEYGMQSALGNLDFLALRHLEDSPFIDWEKGESHFKGREFQEVLEICKKYAGTQSDEDRIVDGNERYEILSKSVAEKRSMAFEKKFYFNNYRDYKKIADNPCRFTGYPGQTGYTGYWSSYVTLIVVNARTEHRDAIAEFLQYFLSAESMGEFIFPIMARADVFRAYYLKNIDLNPYTEEDIDGYIEEVLCKAGPVPRSNKVVADIIRQEAEIFFSGERDAAATADVIDNRVQLYLSERK